MKTSRWLVALSAGLWLASLADAQVAAGQPQVRKDDPPMTGGGPGPCPQGVTSMLINLDASFSVVNFNGPGCNGQATAGDPCQRNDDDITAVVNLPFSFDLFGTLYNQVYVNNNGNISFGAGFCTFTASGFPVAGFPMVAPFWGDVDTRNTASGVVYFRSEPNRFTVISDRVGYYNVHADKLNTFEVIITNGTDPLIGLGNNVAFCYDDMQWTTGDASGGIGGFGGTPATVGVNKGDGVNFFQIGRFGVAGGAYDGPGGNTDGIDYLDNTCYTFNVGGTTSNVNPIYLSPPTSCLPVPVGVPLNFNIQAIGPENNQTVTFSVNSGGLANFSANLSAGNPASASCTFRPNASQVGPHNVTFTATDNFNPPGSTQLVVCLEVLPSIVTYCYGDGAGNGGPDCPCVNQYAGNTSGCVNSTGQGGRLNGVGSPSLAGDTLQLVASDLPPGVPGFYFYGTTQQANPHGGFGIALGDGLRCVSGTVVRMAKIVSVPTTGTVTLPFSGDPPLSVQYPVSVGQSRYYQVWYRNFYGPCGFALNTTNAVCVIWGQ